MNQSLLFRFHRGCIDESMKTVIAIHSYQQLIEHIEEHWDFYPMTIKIMPYVYDDRIHWDTHIVSAHFKGIEKQGFMPVGFLNRNPEWDLLQGEDSEVS